MSGDLDRYPDLPEPEEPQTPYDVAPRNATRTGFLLFLALTLVGQGVFALIGGWPFWLFAGVTQLAYLVPLWVVLGVTGRMTELRVTLIASAIVFALNGVGCGVMLGMYSLV